MKNEIRICFGKMLEDIKEATENTEYVETYNKVIRMMAETNPVDDLFDVAFELHMCDADKIMPKTTLEFLKVVYELGIEGRLLKMQLDELTVGVEKEERLLIKDYVENKTDREAFEDIRKLNLDELAKQQVVAKVLGINAIDNFNEITVYTRGYRILNKVPRMPNAIVENIVRKFKSLQKLLSANIEELVEVDGIGEVRAKTIVQSLKRMQEQFVFDRL